VVCISLVLCGLTLVPPPPLRPDPPKGRAPVTLGDRIEQLVERSGREVSGPPVEGVLVGYALCDPDRGWAEVRKLIEDPSASFLVRYSGLRATARLRLVAPDVVSGEVELAVLAKLLEQPDMTDLVVERLRKDRNWGLTGAILKLQPREPYRRPIIQRSIIRYALDCPDAGAKRFIEGMRRRDKDLVDEVKQSPFDGGGDERGGGPPPVIPDGYEVADVLVRPGTNLDEELRNALGGSAYKRVARWGDEKDRTIMTEFVWEPKAVRPGEKVRILIPTMYSAHAVAQVGGKTVWGGPNVRTGRDVLTPEIEVPAAAGGQPPSRLRIHVSHTSFVHGGVDNVYILRPKAPRK
jgi:hypothetical protein